MFIYISEVCKLGDFMVRVAINISKIRDFWNIDSYYKSHLLQIGGGLNG